MVYASSVQHLKRHPPPHQPCPVTHTHTHTHTHSLSWLHTHNLAPKGIVKSGCVNITRGVLPRRGWGCQRTCSQVTYIGVSVSSLGLCLVSPNCDSC